MHWLVNIANEMSKELQCLEFLGISGTCICNDFEINLNGCDKAFVSQWTRIIPKLGGCAWQVDEVLPGAFAGMIWPGAGIEEKCKVRIKTDEPIDLSPSLRV